MVENPTNNHNIQRPPVGEENGTDDTNWAEEWNSNAVTIDGKLTVVDTEANQSEYTPKTDALYFATDTEVWYRGDGTNWVQQETTGSNPTLDAPTIGSLGSALDLNTNDLTDGGTPVYDASAGVVPANRLDTSPFAMNRRTFHVGSTDGTIEYAKIAKISDGTTNEEGDFHMRCINAAHNGYNAGRTLVLQGGVRESSFDIKHHIEGTDYASTNTDDVLITETAGTGMNNENEYYIYIRLNGYTDTVVTVDHANTFGSFDFQEGVAESNITGTIVYDTNSDSPSSNIHTGSVAGTSATFTQADVTNSLTIGDSASINNSQIVTQATQTITPTTTQTGAYTANNRDCVLADGSGGAFTVTLPAVSTDVYVTVKKIDSSTNAITVATPNSETIDGTSSLSLSSQYDSSTIVSDGTNYFIV